MLCVACCWLRAVLSFGRWLLVVGVRCCFFVPRHVLRCRCSMLCVDGVCCLIVCFVVIVMCCELFVVCCGLFVVRCVLFVVCCLEYVVCWLLFAVCCIVFLFASCRLLIVGY